jgi:ATP-dependent helicase HrpB
VSASPGAGKTTRVPPALIDAGPVILLQPRRVAARAVARRIAEERAWTLGREIGWQIRFEKRFTRDTRLLVVTEGILTARLQQDPLLSDFATIVLDEFHERSIHADLGLALARQAWLARDDLRIVVMSATLDVESVAGYLRGCPVVMVPGAPHRLTVEYGPQESVAEAVGHVVPRTSGQILCFLPGAREIDAAGRDLSRALPGGIEIVPLHGSLDGDAQDVAIRPADTRRVILATNIAETSLTVPGVSTVVDTGQVKIARYDAQRGVDSLALERVTQDSADQRAGRAARLGPGLVRRLWDARDRLRPRREPDIARIDLAGPVLDVLAWGAIPDAFEWFEAPARDRIEPALRLLRRLGAVEAGDPPRITALGRHIQRAPLHPRLARILLDGRGAPEIAAACALLSEGATKGPGDLLTAIDQFDRQPAHVRQVARELQRIAADLLGGKVADRITELEMRHALFTGYADRLARRREGAPDRLTLASGHGASLASDSGTGSSEYVVALDVIASQREGIAESKIRSATRVEREWIVPTSTTVEHRIEEGRVSRRSGAKAGVRAMRVERFDALVLNETPVSADPAAAAELLRDAWLDREPEERTNQLMRRLRFAGLAVDLRAIVHQAALGARSLDDIEVEAHLPFDVRQSLAERAPTTLRVPSGRTTKLEYAEDGSVSASVKLQELFGLAETPSVGPNRVPVAFHLLAPNGRPVQTTRDLRSFWQRTYPEVRREMRGRYPKHPWPEDPWTAPATHRTSRRR